MRILPTDMAIRGCAAHRAAPLGPTGDPNHTGPPLAAIAPTDAETYCGAGLGRKHTLSELSTIEPAFIARRFCAGTRPACRDRPDMGLWSLQRHVIPQTPWLVLVGHTARCGSDDDVAEAEAAIERFAAAPADEGLVIRDIWLLRLRALLARARGDIAAYTDLRDRYRDMAKTLGFEGHIEWAEAMP